jgi:AcrR family transcriptional regulator
MVAAPAGPAAGAVDHRKRPRRRGEALDTAILEATLAELAEAGYARLAMGRIAARAHTSKASLYKRWPNRAELVVAALAHQRGVPDPAPDTGSLREDLLALLRWGAQRLDGLFGEAVRGLMVETLTNPEQTASVRANMFTARDKLMREIMERAAARGDIPVTPIKPHLIGFAPALVDHHFLIYGAPIPDEVLRGIVDDILLPLLTIPAAGAFEPRRSQM